MQNKIVNLFIILILINLLPFIKYINIPAMDYLRVGITLFILVIIFFLLLKKSGTGITINRLGFYLIVSFQLITFISVLVSNNRIDSIIYFIWFNAIISVYVFTISKYGTSIFTMILKKITYLHIYLLISLILVYILDPTSIISRGGNLGFKGMFHNNNTLGMILFITTSIYMIMFNILNSYKSKIFYFLVMGISFGFIIFSQSRASILSFIIILILFMIYKKQKSVLIILFSLLFYFLSSNLISIFRINSYTFEGLLGERYYLFNYVFNSLDNIGFWGIGFMQQESLWGVSDYIIGDNPLNYLSFHNSFLQVIIEMGYMGITIFILILCYTLFKNVSYNYELLVSKFLLVGILVSNLFESALISPGSPVFHIFWLIILNIILRSTTSEFKSKHLNYLKG